MSHALCAVGTCKNYAKKTEGSGISTYFQKKYHVFPKDKLIKKRWIEFCKRKGALNPATSRMCSEHFTEHDYLRDLQHELLGLPIRKKLKPDAIPSQNGSGPECGKTLVSNSSENVKTTEHSYCTIPTIGAGRSKRQERRTIRKRALERIALIAPIDKTRDQSTDTLDLNLTSIKKLKEEKEVLELQKKCLLQKLQEVKMMQLQQKAELQKKNSELLKQVKLSKLKGKELVKEEVTKILGKVFTQCQINCLLKGRNCARWDEATLSRALSIKRIVSKKCYVFLRKALKEPLPSLTTLRMWKNSVNSKACLNDAS